MFAPAKADEFGGPTDRGGFKIAPREYVPVNAKIFSGCLVLAIKAADTAQPTPKSRFVIK